MLEDGAREVPYHLWPGSCRCKRCLAGRSGCQRRGQQQKKREKARPTVTRNRFLVTFFRVWCIHLCGCFADLGFGVAHASDRGGGVFFLLFFSLFEIEHLFSRRYRIIPACTSVRLTVVAQLPEVRVQIATRFNERVPTLFE